MLYQAERNETTFTALSDPVRIKSLFSKNVDKSSLLMKSNSLMCEWVYIPVLFWSLMGGYTSSGIVKVIVQSLSDLMRKGKGKSSRQSVLNDSLRNLYIVFPG